MFRGRAAGQSQGQIAALAGVSLFNDDSGKRRGNGISEADAASCVAWPP
jgi:hypothetical protein